MTSRTNPACVMCPIAYNGLNGRYCNRFHLYVEYSKVPPCKIK